MGGVCSLPWVGGSLDVLTAVGGWEMSVDCRPSQRARALLGGLAEEMAAAWCICAEVLKRGGGVSGALAVFCLSAFAAVLKPRGVVRAEFENYLGYVLRRELDREVLGRARRRIIPKSGVVSYDVLLNYAALAYYEAREALREAGDAPPPFKKFIQRVYPKMGGESYAEN